MPITVMPDSLLPDRPAPMELSGVGVAPESERLLVGDNRTNKRQSEVANHVLNLHRRSVSRRCSRIKCNDFRRSVWFKLNMVGTLTEMYSFRRILFLILHL